MKQRYYYNYYTVDSTTYINLVDLEKICISVKCDTLRDLVPFAQFKNRENTHGGVRLLASNFTKSITLPWVLFRFFKLYRWCQIAQSITNGKNTWSNQSWVQRVDPIRRHYYLHCENFCFITTLSWRWSLSYRNQSNDLQSKSRHWFPYDRNLRHEKLKWILFIKHFVFQRKNIYIYTEAKLLILKSRSVFRMTKTKNSAQNYARHKKGFERMQISWSTLQFESDLMIFWVWSSVYAVLALKSNIF